MKTRNGSAWLAGMVVTGVLVFGTAALAGDAPPGTASTEYSLVDRTVGLGLAAALAIGICTLGAGYAMARIGSAALGALAEKPELFTRCILFIALAEGLAVLGFAIAMLLLQKI
jgi:V/A-type H+/Na+-transporting ATPase subunit K